MTLVAANKQAPMMLASLTGEAKRLAGTISTESFFQDNGEDLLLALLEDRFCGTPGTSSVSAFEALHACLRRDSPMVDYLTSSDEAIAQCTEAGLALDNTMWAHLLLKQAGLSELERSLVISTAGKPGGGDMQFKHVSNTLMVLFPNKGRSGGAALMTETVGNAASPSARGGANRRRTDTGMPSGGAAPEGGVATCWYCSKNALVKNDCRLRARHLKERGIVLPAEQSSKDAKDRADVIHRVVLAGTTGTGWNSPVGRLILDPGATATVADEAWAASFLAALPPLERAGVSRLPSDPRLKFGNGEYVSTLENLNVTLLIGAARYMVRVHVLPGSLPLLVIRPTFSSIGAIVDFKRHVLRIDGPELRLKISTVGHYTLNGLGTSGASPVHGADTSAVVTEQCVPSDLPADVGCSSAALVATEVPTAADDEPSVAAPAPSPALSSPLPVLTKKTVGLDQACRELHVQYSYAAAGRLCALLRV